MNKLFTKIAGLTLGLAMAVGVGVAVGHNGKETEPVSAASATWNKITSDPVSGTEYLILSSDGTKYFDASVATIDSTSNPVAITVSNNSVTGDYDGKAWTFTKSGDNWYISRTLNNTTTYIGRTANSNGINTGSSGIANTITNSSGAFTIKGTGSGSSKQMSYNSSSGRFRYFASGTVMLFERAASKTLSSISLSGYTTSFFVGDTFSFGGTVTAHYSDSTTANVTSSATFSGYNMAAVGNYTVTASYTESGTTKTATYSITVSAAKTLSSIAVTTAPTKTVYSEGESFDSTGMVVTATYSDSTTSNVTSSCTFSPSGALTTDDDEITVSYTLGGVTKTATQAITVNEVDKYELITSAEDLSAGSKYVIGDSTKAHFMSSTQNSNNRGKIDLTPVNDVLSYADGLEVITLGGSAGSWTLHAEETAGYLYAAGANSNNYLRTKNDSTTWTITFSNGTPTLVSAAATRGTMQYNTGGLFACYASASQVNVSLWKLVDTAESIAISKDSVSGFKGDSDTSVSITANNFTPTNISVSYSTANVATVTKGTISDGVIPLTVAYTGVGSTTATITVTGGSQNYTCTLDVTVAAKPASMTIEHSDIHEGVLEVITGAYKQVSFSGEDTDGNAYAIAAGDVTPSATSGASHVTLSGSRITGDSEGDAVVRYTLNALTSVYAEITVHVVDDYIETVGTPTFASNLTDTQGDSPTVSIFTSRPGTMHSGTSTTIPFENYKFSYSNDYASSEYGSVFSYDFSHGTTVDSTHKLQTIYVFCDIDEAAHGSYTVTVEQLDDPLTAITFTNVTSNAVDVVRGSTFQLEWAYTPTNPTDGKEVEFIIDDNSDGIDITVSELGLISIGASSDLGDALVIIQSAHDDSIQDYVVVSAVLETMKYTVNEAESWTKVTDDSTLSAGDVIMVASDAKGKVLGEFTDSNKYANEGTATFSDGSASDVTGALEFTLETGSSSGTWKLKNGTKYLYGTSSKTTLCLSDTATDVTITISSGDATIDFGSSCRILHNVNSTRFSNYTSATSSTMLLPQIYLKSGGATEYDVTETLFNGVHNNFGAGKTYEWSETCSSFNSGNWLSACNALKGITGYSSYKLELAVADMNGNEIEVFLAKYDAIVNKFGTTYDYLGRFGEGGINHGARSVSPLQIVKDNGNTIAIVVVATVVSMAAVGGYFFLRKKKED